MNREWAVPTKKNEITKVHLEVLEEALAERLIVFELFVQQRHGPLQKDLDVLPAVPAAVERVHQSKSSLSFSFFNKLWANTGHHVAVGRKTWTRFQSMSSQPTMAMSNVRTKRT